MADAIDCGGTTCEATVVRGGFGDTILAPCCTASGCGADVGGFSDSVPACQVLGAPAAGTWGCASVEGQYGPYPGCKRADGKCGFDPGGTIGKDMAFGCLLAHE